MANKHSLKLMEMEGNAPFIPPLCIVFPKHVLLLFLLPSQTSLIYSWINHKPVDSEASPSYYFTISKDFTAENTGNIPDDSKVIFFFLSKGYKSAKTLMQ